MRVSKIIIVLSVLFSALPVYGSLTDGLVAHWTFDEPSGNIAYDSAGSNNGTLQGNATRVAGQVGDYALYFGDQRYDYVQGNTSPFNFANTTFTLSGWFKTTSNIFIASEGAYEQSGWGLDIQSTKIHFQLKNGSYDSYYAWSSSSQVYNDGSWHLVTAVITTNTVSTLGNDVEVYVDGLPIGLSENNVKPYAYSSNNWKIGSLQLTVGNMTGYQGFVDDVRIYDRELSADEVLQLYQIPEPATLFLLGAGFLFLIRKKEK